LNIDYNWLFWLRFFML